MTEKRKAKAPVEDRPATAPSKVECIEHIADLIATGRYRSHLTPKELAQRWGLKPSTVQGYAHQASLLLRIGKERRDELQAVHANLLESIIFESRDMRSTQTGIPDYRNVLQAWELFQKYVLGNWGKAESEGPSPADLSDEDLQRLASDALKYVSKQIGTSKPQATTAGD